MQTNKVIKITVFSVILLVIPILLQAQYLGGVGRGDASISLTNAHISVNKIEVKLPTKYELYQNYPNPFNPSTNIRFQIPKNSFVTLKIYDILGKEVATLVNEKLDEGEYEIPFSIKCYNNIKLTSGIYFYRLESDNYTATKKMILLQ